MTNNPRYTLGTEANRIFMASETYELLKFGKGFPAPNGGSGWLNADGTLDPSHGVETWITSRMAHVYSIGAMLGYLGAGELADAALKGLTGILHDDEHGGWYPQVFADGTHAPGKVCYAHAFVILAASSALLAGRPGAKELLDEALATYDKHFWNDEIGLAVDTWNTEFTELDPYRGLNANMHTTEAFLAVADATGDNAYRVRAGRIIDHVIGWAKHNEWRIPEHFKSDWSLDLECNVDKKDDQFKPYGATPGHGIEWARLITQWALSSFANLDGAQPYVDAAEHLFARAVADAWNADGTVGLAYDRLERQARGHRSHALDAGRIVEHFRHAVRGHRRGDVRQLVCHVRPVCRRTCHRPRERLLVPPARQEQPRDRHGLAGQVRPVPRLPVHTDSVPRPGRVHRHRGQERGLTGNILAFLSPPSTTLAPRLITRANVVWIGSADSESVVSIFHRSYRVWPCCP
jgi:mannose/cellobiose epimerase-like protein (N-acyl-D-glucosamine 2-epimerase family)